MKKYHLTLLAMSCIKKIDYRKEPAEVCNFDTASLGSYQGKNNIIIKIIFTLYFYSMIAHFKSSEKKKEKI